MAAAEVGDDVYGEDPAVIALQRRLCELTGHADALFLPSGTQSNLVALLSHCQRGDEYIVAQNAHAYQFEGGGAAVLGGIQPQPLPCGEDGLLALDTIAAAVKPDDIHCARSRLLVLENTHNGQILPLDYLRDATRLASELGLARHLDGARICNAAVASGVTVQTLTELFDSVSVCLSKGLGAPVGSVLCGSVDFITTARRWRKMLGGGMRQCGVLAAAGLYAVEHNIARLADDHTNAQYLHTQLAAVDGLTLCHPTARTNMVFFHLAADADDAHDAFHAYARANGVLTGGRHTVRLVVHKDISRADIDAAITRMRGFFDGN